ncbi:hemolysin secretion protein D [Pseudorhodoplanes sinuspersici]|uniref:Membrane fusion protein (MFP) family protein n=2 Tax=Pseudorhodoplanes sinuspersici TaxID=1235591 RepID=A0A1W6ZZV3_9HYPH|nr:hemolysin secretion protein D [Pseudorhodoplanes sinuspersici]
MSQTDFQAIWDGRVILVQSPGVLSRTLLRSAKDGKLYATRIALGLVEKTRRIAKPDLAKEAAQSAANTAGTAIIDFADRARKLGRAVSIPRQDPDRRRSHELAFLPAALEIVETPPSPVGRATAFALIGVFSAALIWAAVGTVDIVAVAPGKIISGGRNKTIQPFDTSVVRSILVRDGQSVKSGDVLIELDATMSTAEFERLRSDLQGAQLDTARLKAALAGKEDPLSAFTPPKEAPSTLVQMHRRFLTSLITEQNAKLAAIDRQIAQKEAERATISASIEKLKATITPLQQRVEIREQLFQKELGSKLTYLTELQDLVGQRQEILIQQSRYSETDAAIAVLTESRAKAVAEYERMLFDDLSKAEQKAAGLAQDVIKAEQRTSLQRLTAPIDGVVQQLAVHTIGGVVTPAQALMVIVPADSGLEIEAMISNRDIGFVEVGQDAEIKIDTFSFTRYGLLQGKILDISQDAITRNKPQDDKQRGGEASSSEPKGQELVYAARVSLDRTQMEIENKRVNLSPGMATTVEIKTGSRSIISYLLSPLMRYKHESLRER